MNKFKLFLSYFTLIGGLTSTMTSILFGVYFLPEILDSVSNVPTFFMLKILIPLGVVFWGVNGFLLTLLIIERFLEEKE